jgi:hypothetical protein
VGTGHVAEVETVLSLYGEGAGARAGGVEEEGEEEEEEDGMIFDSEDTLISEFKVGEESSLSLSSFFFVCFPESSSSVRPSVRTHARTTDAARPGTQLTKPTKQTPSLPPPPTHPHRSAP